jgi:hypothetical protein
LTYPRAHAWPEKLCNWTVCRGSTIEASQMKVCEPADAAV